jgi:hypothetical protein
MSSNSRCHSFQIALAVLDLDAPDQRKMHALVAALGPQLQRRAVLDQRRHLADVFQRLVVTTSVLWQ